MIQQPTAGQLGQITVVLVLLVLLAVFVARAVKRRRRPTRRYVVHLYGVEVSVLAEVAPTLRCEALRKDVERAIAEARLRIEQAPSRAHSP